MRKIFPVLVALAILLSCAIPAFAVGGGSARSNVVSALPFQFMYFEDFGGPFEYPFAMTRRGGNTITYTYTSATRDVLSVRASSSDTYMDGIMYFSKSNAIFTLELKNDIVSVYGTEGMMFYSYLATTDVAFWKVRIYGSYYDVVTDEDGEPLLKEVPFDKLFHINGQSFYPYDLLYDLFVDDFEGKFEFFDPAYQLFKSLSFDVSLIRENEDGKAQIEIYTPMSCFTDDKVAYSPESWLMEQLGKYDFDFPVPPDLAEFNIGSFLVSTVGPFLDFEIFPNFNFGTLLFMVIVLGVFIAFLKITI